MEAELCEVHGFLDPSIPQLFAPMAIEVKTKFPVARIKRIMQADEDVGKVAQVTPIAVCKLRVSFSQTFLTSHLTASLVLSHLISSHLPTHADLLSPHQQQKLSNYS